MKGSISLFLILWIFWVLLGGLSLQEVVAGGAISAFVTLVVGRVFSEEAKVKGLRGFAYFLAYIPYYVYQEILAVSDVVCRILTNKIAPAVVKVRHSHTHGWGITALSNSITMTPGTLTLEAGPKHLYVHWLTRKEEKEEITERFEKFLRRVWD